MIPVWLIARVLLRQQRFALFVFLGWIVGFGLLFGIAFSDMHPDDLLALFQQQALYLVLFGFFIACSVLHAEKTSRRILTVATKGISRRQYLAGVLLANTLLVCSYAVALGIVNQLLALRLHFQLRIWETLAAVLAAAVLSIAVAVFFSTFMHPMLAGAATAITLAAPLAAVALGASTWPKWLPVAFVLGQVFYSDFSKGWSGGWDFLPIALAEIIFFWWMAAGIFRHRDLTSPED